MAAGKGLEPALAWTILTGVGAAYFAVIRWVVLLTKDVADLKKIIEAHDERLKAIERLSERMTANQEDVKSILAFMVTQNQAAEAFVAIRSLEGPTLKKP